MIYIYMIYAMSIDFPLKSLKKEGFSGVWWLYSVFERSTAASMVYLSQAGGSPSGDFESFSDAYDALKNRKEGDAEQARILLRSMAGRGFPGRFQAF